jgi:hypothetical protein
MTQIALMAQKLVGYACSDTVCSYTVEQMKRINSGGWELPSFNYRYEIFMPGCTVTVILKYCGLLQTLSSSYYRRLYKE